MMRPIVIDSDSHYMPRDVFADVDPRFEQRAPRFWVDAVGRSRVSYPDREAALSPAQRQWKGFNIWMWRHPGNIDPEPRIEFMDEQGIDMQVLVPSEQFHYDVDR